MPSEADRELSEPPVPILAAHRPQRTRPPHPQLHLLLFPWSSEENLLDTSFSLIFQYGALKAEDSLLEVHKYNHHTLTIDNNFSVSSNARLIFKFLIA